ncbi:helix-turn-helix transcriptional regulator [Brevibacillus fulvus]|uniref:AraC-like DNA-binding protein n=1 Tax=Brevibacillus fulvus TaxID=1125967 RepID=A0A938XXT7_9BACL|nr:AraC family transcriptional regulator [Brevibacillus fulvus]MBM7589670.1 AraC-like DNA-binding protein [Brevibacillus fulvus]
MLVIWEVDSAASHRQETLTVNQHETAPFVYVHSFAEVKKLVEEGECSRLLIVCANDTLPDNYDLTAFFAKTAVYLFTSAQKEAKLILHFLLYQWMTNDFSFIAVEEEGERVDDRTDTGQINWNNSLKYIHENLFDNNLCLEDVASLNYVCKWHFSKLFKRKLGVTFREYIIRERIEEAKRRLQRDDSITDVCYAVGYGDLTHFGRIFRQRVGMTPSDFRQKYRRKQRSG